MMQEFSITKRLNEAGFEVVVPSLDHTWAAKVKGSSPNDMSGGFLFAQRMKESASYHNKTSKYELGVDAPDYNAYSEASLKFPRIPYLIFFEVLSDLEFLYIISIQDLLRCSRWWKDEVYFPRGIYFVSRDNELVVKWQRHTHHSIILHV